MRFPSFSEYDAEVVNLDRSVLDSRFRGGKAKWIGPNIVAYSGGVSRVYPITLPEKTVALRCWVAEVGQQRERYREVSRYLREAPLEYFVDFDYIEQGIMVQGRHYPVIYMDWVDGLPLCEFIDEHFEDPESLMRVAGAFEAMVSDLHRRHVAHGDLQDGNIIVCERPGELCLRLIDYDTMYVPSLKGWENNVTTVPDYQHPRRAREPEVTDKDDYFSELVIYLSLRVITERPDLWIPGQERRLLFSRRDFDDPEHSAIFHETARLSSEVQRLSWHLQQFCRTESITHLQPLEEVIRAVKGTTAIPREFEEIFGGAPREAAAGASRAAGTRAPGPAASPPSGGRSSELDDFFKRPVEVATPAPSGGPAPVPPRVDPAAPAGPGVRQVLGVVVLVALLLLALALFVLGE